MPPKLAICYAAIANWYSKFWSLGHNPWLLQLKWWKKNSCSSSPTDTIVNHLEKYFEITLPGKLPFNCSLNATCISLPQYLCTFHFSLGNVLSSLFPIWIIPDLQRPNINHINQPFLNDLWLPPACSSLAWVIKRIPNIGCLPWLQFLSFFLFNFYFALQYCIGFSIHWHESATGVHEFPILNPPPYCFLSTVLYQTRFQFPEGQSPFFLPLLSPKHCIVP